MSSPDDTSDDGSDARDDARDDGPDAPDTGAESGDASASGGEPGTAKRKRRRRRRGAGAGAGAAGAPVVEGAAPAVDGAAPAEGAPPAASPAPQPQQARGPRPPREPRPPQAQQGPRPPQPQGQRQPQAQGPRQPQPPRGPRPEGGGRPERGERGERRERALRPPGADVPRPDRASEPPRPRREQPAAAVPTVTTSEPTMPRLAQQVRAQQPHHDDDLEPPTDVPAVAWGTDDGTPAPAVTLAADLPLDPRPDDPDPASAALLDGTGATFGGGDVASVVGVRFVAGGRLTWFDAGDIDFAASERVMVDSDRGPRLAWIAAPPVRRVTRDRGLRRVIRRATDTDLRGEREGDDERARCLRAAKDAAEKLRLPLKVFRVELQGGSGRNGKLNVYYTCDERVDLRELVRELGTTIAARVELRQLGTRDEAKAVGGIGSCGLTLCCTTWMPEFVPVSIKMAKDQGLSLAPSKVMGQCGRLKCCLVYEQAGYAELRKGLPKLGKRVLSPRGEGRVVEVDVLRQRLRVSYGMGDSEVLPAADVKPLFPPGGGPGGSGRPATSPSASGADAGDAPEPADEVEEPMPELRDLSDLTDPPEPDEPTDDPSAAS